MHPIYFFFVLVYLVFLFFEFLINFFPFDVFI